MVQKRARIYNIILCTFESSFLTEISERFVHRQWTTRGQLMKKSWGHLGLTWMKME
jgi:hypothetical protein